MSAINIIQPGMLATIQDTGRYGQTHLGLTNGGVADRESYYWLNRLLGNSQNSACIELTIGGLKFTTAQPTQFCVTGAEVPVTINGHPVSNWQTHTLKAKDKVEIGFAKKGVRAYVGFRGGLAVPKQFGSVATVIREQVGGINGLKLGAGQKLELAEVNGLAPTQFLATEYRPEFDSPLTLRVVPGYQQKWFSRLQQRRFFSGIYNISAQADRMGYRLQGPAIECEHTTMLSEGISLGAVQVPADGQPIILLQDRQTIGGYPKLGSVLSLDIDKLVQRQQGSEIQFEAISMDCAHNALLLEKARREQIELSVV